MIKLPFYKNHAYEVLYNTQFFYGTYYNEYTILKRGDNYLRNPIRTSILVLYA